MSEFHNSPVVVSGKGSNVGDYNTSTSIESLNIQNITQLNGAGGKEPEIDPRLAALGAVVAVVAAAWFYLRHFFQIHDVLYVGCFLSVVPALFSVLAASMRGDDPWSSAFKVIPTCLIAFGLLVVLAQIRDAMPQDVLDLAANSSAKETWGRLSDLGKRIVLESGGGAAICAITVVLNLLAGLRAVADASGKWANWIFNLTAAFKMGRCVVANAVFVALAWGISSGAAYDYWKAFQIAMAPAGA